jgi:predicted DNA-binding transcriptional regulator AlpA
MRLVDWRTLQSLHLTRYSRQHTDRLMKQEPPGFPVALNDRNGGTWSKRFWVLEEVEAWHREKIDQLRPRT